MPESTAIRRCAAQSILKFGSKRQTSVRRRPGAARVLSAAGGCFWRRGPFPVLSSPPPVISLITANHLPVTFLFGRTTDFLATCWNKTSLCDKTGPGMRCSPCFLPVSREFDRVGCDFAPSPDGGPAIPRRSEFTNFNRNRKMRFLPLEQVFRRRLVRHEAGDEPAGQRRPQRGAA